jgi:sulfite reductase (ferredoxin)
MVHIPLPLGDIEAGTIESLAGIIENHGERLLRTTQYQNMVIRWVHENELEELYARLSRHNLTSSVPPVLRDLLTCTGASTCKLGICLSRGLAKAVVESLSKSSLDLNGLGELKIHINGCPNACGRHPIAQIGLFGAARRINGKLVPHYVVQLGGRVGEGKTRLASGNWPIPAKNVPAFLVAFLQAFSKSAIYPDFENFIEIEGRKVADELLITYKDVPDFEKDKNYYFDWGSEKLFSMGERGPGECSAGVFDLIEVDLASASQAITEKKYYTATVLAARSLLVTRGEQPGSDVDALKLFQKHFIGEGLVDQTQEKIITKALSSTSISNPEQAFVDDHDSVARFINVIKSLYASMDQSLRFQTIKKDEALSETPVDKTSDFRGVVCPLNYMKTKMALDQIKSGQTLLVLLDEAGAKNVPESASQDGHKVLSISRDQNHWKVLIQKG